MPWRRNSPLGLALLALALWFLPTAPILIVVRAATYTDTFTEGAADTALASHTPDSGGMWTENEDTTPGTTIDAIATTDEASPAANANGARLVYTVNWTPASAIYDVSVKWAGTPASLDDAPGCLAARFTDTSNYYYACIYSADSNPDVVLGKNVAGTRTDLATGDCGVVDGDTVLLQMRTAAKTVLKNGGACGAGVSSADNALTSAGVVGLAVGNVTATTTDDTNTAIDMDDFSLVDQTEGGGTPGAFRLLLTGVGD